MGIFDRFKKPKCKFKVELDDSVYDATDKFSGRIVVDTEEELQVDEFKLEVVAHSKTKWKQKGRWGSSSLSTSSSLGTKEFLLSGPIKIPKGQHYEKRFKVDIPKHARPDFYRNQNEVKEL
ncbi:MAG: hypothetical protein ACOC6G_00315 [Thermoproteota archaeon]